MQGVTLKYGFDFSTAGNQLLATVTKADLNEQTKALAEGHLAGMANLLGGADLAAGQGIHLAARAAQSPGQRSPQAFGALSGGRLRHDTGSHLDVDGYHLLAGFAAGGELSGLSQTQATLGAFFEYGEAKAKTHGYKIDATKLKGDTGSIELGLTLTPTLNKPLNLDLGPQGYAGQREGVTGSVRVNYRF